MEHTLDNPIWNALKSGNKDLAEGNQQASYFKRTVAAFAGLESYSAEDFEALYRVSPFDDMPVVLFTPGEITVPVNWEISLKKNITQMVYAKAIPAEETVLHGTALMDKDVPAMIALATLTKPGPFLSRTIEFGNYEGIFDGSNLVAMAGQRMQPDPYTEISAVCTHPDFAGRGYAAVLIRRQVRQIIQAGRIPFLHVFSDNFPALNLYLKLGFSVRREMTVYVLQKKTYA